MDRECFREDYCSEKEREEFIKKGCMICKSKKSIHFIQERSLVRVYCDKCYKGVYSGDF